MKRVDVKRLHNLFFTRVALCAITMRNNLSVSCNRQQFEIPHTIGNDLMDSHDYASHKSALVKQIVTKQIAEKNMALKKPCRLSALEKLLGSVDFL